MRQPLRSCSFGKVLLQNSIYRPAGVVDPARLAELGGGDARQRQRHRPLDRLLDVVGKLRARRAEELDPVVVERIVRCADDDPGGQPERAREIGDRRRGQRTRKIDVDARRRQSRFERRLEQVTRDPRVLADEDRRPRARASRLRRQHAARRPAELQHELRRDRRLADPAADSVGAEVLSRHDVSLALSQATL